MSKSKHLPEPTICCPDAVANWLAGVHGMRLRYVAAWKRWMVWDGARWRADKTLLAFDLARDLARTMINAARLDLPDATAALVARRLGSPGFVAQVERLARTDRMLAAEPEQWDADRDLLNTPAGIVDLRSAALSPHRHDAYMTHLTAVAPAAPGTPCPLWHDLVDRMAGGDAGLHFFLQRVAGRALAVRGPQPRPEATARPGALGMHVFIDTFARILGGGDAGAALREGLALVRLDEAAADPARDPDLAARLAGEYPAILRWAIDGALAWRKIGLSPPVEARRPALADAIGRFLDESAEASPAAWVSTGDLYAAWRAWADVAGSNKRFCQMIAARGFVPSRRHGGRRGFAGLRLRRPAAAGEPDIAGRPGIDAEPAMDETRHASPSVTTTAGAASHPAPPVAAMADARPAGCPVGRTRLAGVISTADSTGCRT